MPTYTVAMCNYNMVETLRESLRSVVGQLPADDYGVLVVDGGSDDGSVAILAEFADRYDNVRYVALDPDPDRRLGADRQVSFEHARGEYVLFQIDTDDRYYRGITDFVTVYEALAEASGKDPLMLKGEAIVMAPRSYLLEHGFHNLTGAEDMDLYRRALANGAILYLKHYPFWESIGYDKDDRALLKRIHAEQTCNFQTGVTFASYLRWILRDCTDYTRYTIKYRLAELLLLPYSYYVAGRREQFPVPAPYGQMGRQYEERFARRKILSEYEEEYDFSAEADLSPAGREIFYGEGVAEADADLPETRTGHVCYPADGDRTNSD